MAMFGRVVARFFTGVTTVGVLALCASAFAQVPPEIRPMLDMLRAQGRADVAAEIERMAATGQADPARLMSLITNAASGRPLPAAPPASAPPQSVPRSVQAPAPTPKASPLPVTPNPPATANRIPPEIRPMLDMLRAQGRGDVVAEIERMAATGQGDPAHLLSMIIGGAVPPGAPSRVQPVAPVPQQVQARPTPQPQPERPLPQSAQQPSAASVDSAKATPRRLTGYVAFGQPAPEGTKVRLYAAPVEPGNPEAERDNADGIANVDSAGAYFFPKLNSGLLAADRWVKEKSQQAEDLWEKVRQPAEWRRHLTDAAVDHCDKEWAREVTLSNSCEFFYRRYPEFDPRSQSSAECRVSGHCRMFGIAQTDNATAHVTPLTDTIARINAQDATGRADDEAVIRTPSDRPGLANVVANVKKVLGPGAPDDPLADPAFVPDPERSRHDKFLETVKTRLAGDNLVATDVDGKVLARAPIAAITGNTVNGDQQTISAAKMAAAEAALAARRAVLVERSGELTVSPKKAVRGELTTFTVKGAKLMDGMRFTLEGCSNIREMPGGTETERQFSCTPLAAGPMSGYLKDRPGGITVYGFHVTIGNPDTPKPPPTAAAMAPRVPAFVAPAAQGPSGAMTLGTPFGYLTRFEFPSTPAQVSQNPMLARIGVSQGQIVFTSTTQIAKPGGGAYSTGPIRITVTEIGSAESVAIGIRVDSAASHGTRGELVPVSDGGMCLVRGRNTQNLPSCAGLGITFDKQAGRLSFANTRLYPLGISNTTPNTIIGLDLRFTPY